MGRNDRVAEVTRYWHAQSLPAKRVDLGALTPDLRSALPHEYVAFLEAGLPEREDQHGFLFWQPEALRTADELLMAQAKTDERAALRRLLVFADYLTECWWYGICLSGPNRGHVSIITGTNDPHPPLATFEGFLAAYVKDAPILYETGATAQGP